jgi:phage terminase large subunit
VATKTTSPEIVLRRWRDDPVAFAEDVLGSTLAAHQKAVLRSLAGHSRVAVRSAHGLGKTHLSAIAVLWFLFTRPQSRVVTTAPTWRQVSMLLWREIANLHTNAKLPLGGELLATELRIGPTWFAMGQSSDKPESFAGHHARHMLLVVDEASGVDEQVYAASEGFLTGQGSKVLMVGNPTRPAGAFYRAFTRDHALYATHALSAYDSPAITGSEDLPADVTRRFPQQEWVDRMAALYGEESPVFAVRVKGEFPGQADDTVVGLAAVEAAQRRELEPTAEPLVVACDVARYGADETVISTREGQVVRLADVARQRDTMGTAGAILRVARELHGRYPSAQVRLVVDDAGVGGGVVDRLREQAPSWATVEPFLGSQAPVAADKRIDTPNRRSEAWFAFADQIDEIDLDQDEQLLADLVAPGYRLDSAGRRVVEPKDGTKKRLGRSPDRADAVLMALAPRAAGPDWSSAGSVAW